MSESVATIPAADLVEEGRCSPLCLVARDNDRRGKCQCRCKGEFHGALADAPVESSGPIRWWEACRYGGWSLVHCPIVRSKRDDFRLWKEATVNGDPACWVEAVRTREVGHCVIWDAATMRLCTHELMELWPLREARLLNRMMVRLMEAGRVRTGFWAPGEHMSITGVPDLDEARTIALIVGECFAANPCGAVRAIEVLEGRPDPTALGLNPEHGFPDALAYVDNPSDAWRRA